MQFINPGKDHKLHIPLCSICQKPLFAVDGKEAIMEFNDPWLKRTTMVHQLCERVRMYEIGMTSHLISAELAEA